MSAVTTNQPLGTPRWIDLGIPDLDWAKAFYGSVFGWEFEMMSVAVMAAVPSLAAAAP